MFESQPLLAFLVNVAWRLGLSFGIVVLTRWLAPWTRQWLRTMLARTKLTSALVRLSVTLVYYGVWITAGMAILGVLGMPLDVILTSFGIVIVVLGIALQQSLRDLAATVSFLLFAPFEIGDQIETGGTIGTVLEIQPFASVILRGDNKTVILSNGQIQQNGIVNYSKVGILRVDLVFGISYNDDVRRARQIAQQVLDDDPRVLADPAPIIVLLALRDSSVDLGVRPFVKEADYWRAGWDLTERIKQAFDEAGITIPFPQRDVHMIQDSREQSA